MQLLRVFVFSALGVLLSVVQGVSGAEPQGWQAGAARVSITPDTPVWMAGYAARTGPSDGVLTEIYVRAVAFKDANDHRLVMLAMDLIEIPDSLRKSILEVARKNHGLDPHELLLNVSHTHGGPMLSAKNVADWGIDAIWGRRAEDYVKDVVRKVDSALGESLSKMQTVTVSYSHARCGFAMNRRLKTSDGFRLGPNPDGVVDHDVPVLRIESQDGKLLGVVFGYACHNTALGPVPQLHGDYAGFAQEKLEQDHPETIALFLAGCGGDQDPSPRRHVDDARQNGLALASAVEGALAAAPVRLDAALSTTLETVPLAFASLPPRAELETRAKSGNGFVARHAQMILQNWPNAGDAPPDYRYPVQVATFGKTLSLIALGGEPMAEYAVRLKRELANDGRRVWVAGYSNLVNAYIPNRRVLAEGGYEGTEAIIYQSLPAPFRPELEDRIIESVHRQVQNAR